MSFHGREVLIGHVNAGRVSASANINVEGTLSTVDFTSSGHAILSGSVVCSVTELHLGAAAGAAAFGTAVGYGAVASVGGAVAVGSVSLANQFNATSIGSGATASGLHALSLGSAARASASVSMALGVGADASGVSSMALGFGSTASGVKAVAIGFETEGTGLNGVAIGASAAAVGPGSIALGSTAAASSSYSMAIGFGANVTGGSSIGIGTNVELTDAVESVVVGGGSTVTPSEGHVSTKSVLLGWNNDAAGMLGRVSLFGSDGLVSGSVSGCTMLGWGSTVTGTLTDGLVLGHRSAIVTSAGGNGSNAIVIGNGSTLSGTGAGSSVLVGFSYASTHSAAIVLAPPATTGRIIIPRDLPVAADNDAAILAGYPAGTLYRTTLGAVMIVMGD